MPLPKLSAFWHAYRGLTTISSPLIRGALRLRLIRGKEHPLRIHERLGRASLARPAGPLVWIHGASIGEAVSAFPVISALQDTFPGVTILLTTGTFSSAQFLPSRLPAKVLHQCSPVDVPSAVTRFLDHWRPDIALLLENELWPNLMLLTAERGIPIVLLNARMSEKSFRTWQHVAPAAQALLSVVRMCLAQDEDNANRFRRLGMQDAIAVGNLKSSAPPLASADAEIAALADQIGGRRRWLASSTHEGEELVVAEAHIELKKVYPDLLTLLVPRHPDRSEEIGSLLQKMGLKVARRSRRERPAEDVDCYLADTFGELGIFYRLADIVFMGATLVPKGGHNPLEAARLNCAIFHGPHTDKNAASYASLDGANAAVCVTGLPDFVAVLRTLMVDPSAVERMAHAAARIATQGDAALTQVLTMLKPLMLSRLENRTEVT